MDLLKRDFVIREPLLIGILVLIALAFSAVTHAYSRAYDRRRAALGTEWFEHGRAELQGNRPAIAVEDFRTALVYAPRNWEFGLHLADALTRAGRSDEAFHYYLGLWQASPNSGIVNLQLARLSAQRSDPTAAERYFNGAIFGEWPHDAPAHRREASFDLVNFYLDRGDIAHAESQLLILSDNLPQDSQLHLRVAELYARVGADERALNEYRKAIQLDPADAVAMRGAGKASFHLAEYQVAQAYLDRSLHLDPSDSSAERLLGVVQSAISLNPYERGITQAQKIKRTLRVFDIAGSRLASCAASAGIVQSLAERWRQLKAIASERFLTQHPEEIETLLDFSGSAEKATESGCSEPSSVDLALLAIAAQRTRANR